VVAAVEAAPANPVSVEPPHPVAIAEQVLEERVRQATSLQDLVGDMPVEEALSPEMQCLAQAVYFEARGEPLAGQLAVAKVVMNRATSGLYPTDYCSVVTQRKQFSFVRNGHFPSVDESSAAWRKALGITRLAVANAVTSVPTDCLWYHADYVAPSWGQRLTRVEKIGAHIFYRS
ncbi:MAG: cell wall hydrolase, partial [Sphingomicrobium sp.]